MANQSKIQSGQLGLKVEGSPSLIHAPAILLLQVNYPDAYPDKPPLLDLSNPPNAAKYPHLDIQEDKSRLLGALQPVIEENMGMAMVFTLVSTLKDSAELLISERQRAVQALKDVEAAKAEEEENKKFHGTAVTRESFLAWRAKFRQESEEDERREREEKETEDKKKRGPKEEKKMTGRELWERGLVGKVEEDDEGEDGLNEMERLKIEQSKIS
ncbi:MAG: hypothetical protein M1830_003485 [Pleopsidium flavum]|nr:MAG: hypothetical protein M1830_003485 [Pleopsidium flavum]